eukprot:TRINITY_DN4994_c1_g1_i10.p1 TRINITY_DN4994_c1_g1~~TRINITY_DN4994_c1_g1_i10.p1  ORF type:complete len:116 (-),score=18.35 TRINITY_DN4994_c1_g1_i10:236-556(-)
MIEQVMGLMALTLNGIRHLCIARFLATIPPEDLLPYLIKKIELKREEDHDETKKIQQEQTKKRILDELDDLTQNLAKKRGDKNIMKQLEKSKDDPSNDCMSKSVWR